MSLISFIKRKFIISLIGLVIVGCFLLVVTFLFNGMSKHVYFDLSKDQRWFDSSQGKKWNDIDISSVPYAENKFLGISRLANNYCVKARGKAEELSFCVDKNGISTFIWSIYITSQSTIELHFYRAQKKLIVNNIHDNVRVSTFETSLYDLQGTNKLANNCKKVLIEIVSLIENSNKNTVTACNYGFLSSQEFILEGDYLKSSLSDEILEINSFFNKLLLINDDLIRQEKECFVTTSGLLLD